MVRALVHLRAAQREILALTSEGVEVPHGLDAIKMAVGCVRFARHLHDAREHTRRGGSVSQRRN
jgi:type II secretory pathway component PulF